MTDSRDRALLNCYRHDVHKLNRQPHDTAPETFAGVPVNQSVPDGADRDASALSRPSGEPDQTMDNHQTHYRLSLVTGDSQNDPDESSLSLIREKIRELVTTDDPEAMHRAWLSSGVVSAFNESVYYPYTSLKYHTLLVAALFANYRDGHAFEGLRLIVDPADRVIPHRTVFAGDRYALRIDADPAGQPWARLGSRSWRSWSSTWSRLTDHPLDTAHDEYDRVLDANLRRIRSWSTALQYIEDFEQWGERP